MEETLSLTRLGVSGNLKRTLESTNPCESMIEIVRRTQRNVKRSSSGEMALRWTAAGMLEAEKQFRRIIGYRDLATLVIAIERDHDRRRATLLAPRPRRPLSSSPRNRHTRPPSGLDLRSLRLGRSDPTYPCGDAATDSVRAQRRCRDRVPSRRRGAT
jgi:hypothetical protein